MNDDYSNSMPEEWREVMEAHLDRIEDALVGTTATRLERRAIVDEVEAQILDMVSNAGDSVHGLDGFKTLMATLDAPEKYASSFESRGTEATPPPVSTPRRKWSIPFRLGRWSTFSLVSFGLTVFVTLASLSSGPPNQAAVPTMFVSMVGVVATAFLALQGYRHASTEPTGSIRRRVPVFVFVAVLLFCLNITLLCSSLIAAGNTVMFLLATVGWALLNCCCFFFGIRLLRNADAVSSTISAAFAPEPAQGETKLV